MQNSTQSKLRRVNVLASPDRYDLLDWQILWISENVPRGAMIAELFRVYLDDINMEVGIEIMYDFDGKTHSRMGLLH